MMRFIEVPILCHTDSSSELEKLGIKAGPDSEIFETRFGRINVDAIYAYYPSGEEGELLVHVQGDTVSVMMSYKDFNKLIDQYV